MLLILQEKLHGQLSFAFSLAERIYGGNISNQDVRNVFELVFMVKMGEKLESLLSEYGLPENSSDKTNKLPKMCKEFFHKDIHGNCQHKDYCKFREDCDR